MRVREHPDRDWVNSYLAPALHSMHMRTEVKWASRWEVRVRSEETGAARVAEILSLIDREFRRAAAIVGQLSDEKHPQTAPPRPIPLSEGGVNIDEVRKGSLDFAVSFYGTLETFAENQPLDLLLTFYGLFQLAAGVRRWLKSRASIRAEGKDVRDVGPDLPHMVDSLTELVKEAPAGKSLELSIKSESVNVSIKVYPEKA